MEWGLSIVKRTALLSIFAVVVSFAVCADERWPGAYARRDFQLGMTISAFRATPFPDQKEWPGSEPVCSDDERAKEWPINSELRIRSDWATAGVLMCKHFWTYKNDKRPSTSGLVLGDINASTDFYFLPPGEGSEPVLFYIETTGPSANFDSLLGVFEKGIGKPAEVKDESFQNAFGADFKNTSATWKNSVSTIQLSRYADDIKRFLLTHTLDDVHDELVSRIADVQEEQAKRL